MKRPELLAPAGDLNRCKTAIRYGADAVYLGGQSFSLRSRASNFSLEEIKEACQYAAKHHARIHVTVNMIPHSSDMEGLETYLKQLEECGVHAIIVASVSMMKLARKVAPKLEVHCSTQMSITNADAAKYLVEACGIHRVVLARECSLAQVEDITKNCPVETEVFIHGGMCVNLSGRCTLSNRMTNRDANRGGCAQSCRWGYHLFDGDQELTNPEHLFTMGSKDLCAVSQIEPLIKVGVSSFKIEGRMKTEYYVACVVHGYRTLIDAIMEKGTLTSQDLETYQKNILKAQNRPVCSGFYEGIAGKESIIDHEDTENMVNHDFLGKILTVDSSSSTVTLQTRNPISVGDLVEVLQPFQESTPFSIEWIKNEKGEYLEQVTQPMSIVTLPIPGNIQPEDLLRRVSL